MRDIINGILAALIGLTILTGIYALYVGASIGNAMMIFFGLVDILIVIGIYLTFKK